MSVFKTHVINVVIHFLPMETFFVRIGEAVNSQLPKDLKEVTIHVNPSWRDVDCANIEIEYMSLETNKEKEERLEMYRQSMLRRIDEQEKLLKEYKQQLNQLG